ncbi:MAG: PqqD family protein [Candidatus Aminicenantes bacterium]|nr:PqqD family protein [Candidatus Aminicenantes bacterium]
MNLEGKFRKKESIASRTIAGESFLVPVCGQPADMQKIFVLNNLAAFIWEHLDGEHTVVDLLGAIVEQFAVDREQARLDTVEFIGQLLEQNLLEGVA